MKNVVQMSQRWETIREAASPSLICLILVLLVALLIGVAIGVLNSTYSTIIAGPIIIAIITLLRLDELIVTLIVATHILVDSYLGLDIYQIALLMALGLLLIYYFRRSANSPWNGPRLLWLWVLFLVLNIYPTVMNGNEFRLSNAIAFYLNLVLSAFIMFWLGNIIAKDIAAVRRVFQLLSILAVFIAIHTIIEATTGKFLFLSSAAEVIIAKYSHFQLQGIANSTRFGSFFINPDDDGIFLATSLFLPLGLLIESKQLWAKTIYSLEMLLILLALMFTYSTGSWIAVLIGIIVFTFSVEPIRNSILLLISMIALAVIIYAFFPAQVAVQVSHATDESDHADHLGTWQTAARVIEAYPVFGVGLGDIYRIRSEPFRVSAQDVPQSEPDNSYLQWGATSGIPTMLVFLVLLGCIFRFSWRNWQAGDISYRPLLGGGIVALMALSINSLVVDGWTGPAGIEYLGWLIAGMVISPLPGHHPRQYAISSIDKAMKIVKVQTGTGSNEDSQTGFVK